MNTNLNDSTDVIINLDNNNKNKETEKQNSINNDKVGKLGFNEIKNSLYETLGIKNANKPFICFLHIIFKILSIFNYLFGGFYLSRMTQFIFIILLSMIDFWVVKNITGRLLVSLRWWKVNDEEGKEIWYFETNNKVEINKVDKNIFWWSQAVIFLYWVMILCLKLITIDIFWATLGTISIFLSGINLYGYWKCSKEMNKVTDNLKNKFELIKYLPNFLK